MPTRWQGQRALTCALWLCLAGLAAAKAVQEDLKVRHGCGCRLERHCTVAGRQPRYSSTGTQACPARAFVLHAAPAACPPIHPLTLLSPQVTRCEDVALLGPEDDKCEFVREHCKADSLVNYLEAYYCHVAPRGWKPAWGMVVSGGRARGTPAREGMGKATAVPACCAHAAVLCWL